MAVKQICLTDEGLYGCMENDKNKNFCRSLYIEKRQKEDGLRRQVS